jgi:Ca-activated chloride channel homolog
MKKKSFKSLTYLAIMIILTGTAMAWSKVNRTTGAIDCVDIPAPADQDGIVSISGTMTQDKIIFNGNGQVSVALDLKAKKISSLDNSEPQKVDMIVVIDRSGSMQGNKLADAKNAINHLVDNLSADDRFALVSYSNRVIDHTGLLAANQNNKLKFRQEIQKIIAAGGTNLGGGLGQGIKLAAQAAGKGNLRKVVLVSDGLANHGITNPRQLAKMAGQAVKGEFGISTVGLGNDFNEVLMTSIADHGAGNYYYLETPQGFAKVFNQEFSQTRAAVATGIKVMVNLPAGVSLVDASGYPVEIKNNTAVFFPGSLLNGQTRKLYLTFKVPSDKEKDYLLGNIKIDYQHRDEKYSASVDKELKVACVKKEQEVYSSINSKTWEQKVIKDDFNRLREKVATALRQGKKKDAITRIDQYKREQQAVNNVVGSSIVADNLEQEVAELRSSVEETFKGNKADVAKKQKSISKNLQFRGYKERRSLKN